MCYKVRRHVNIILIVVAFGNLLSKFSSIPRQEDENRPRNTEARRQTSSTLLALELSKYSTTTQASHLASLLCLESPAERLLTRPAYKLPARAALKRPLGSMNKRSHTLAE
jgi:hypothetical protein